MSEQKGSIGIFIIIAVLVVIGTSGYFLVFKGASQSPTTTTEIDLNIESAITTDKGIEQVEALRGEEQTEATQPSAIAALPEGWSLYSDDETGFSFGYPPEDGDQVMIIDITPPYKWQQQSVWHMFAIGSFGQEDLIIERSDLLFHPNPTPENFTTWVKSNLANFNPYPTTEIIDFSISDFPAVRIVGKYREFVLVLRDNDLFKISWINYSDPQVPFSKIVDTINFKKAPGNKFNRSVFKLPTSIKPEVSKYNPAWQKYGSEDFEELFSNGDLKAAIESIPNLPAGLGLSLAYDLVGGGVNWNGKDYLIVHDPGKYLVIIFDPAIKRAWVGLLSSQNEIWKDTIPTYGNRIDLYGNPTQDVVDLLVAM